MDAGGWEDAMKAATEAFPASQVVVRCDDREHVLHVLEASTPEQRRLGLMFRYRNELQHDGMLFRYPSDVTAAFHMANTWMPLRIYWFDSEGACVGSANLEAHSSRQVPAPRPFRYALEMPADRCVYQEPRLIL
jgi:uncharacterized membrane protein (UPF0127 family)